MALIDRLHAMADADPDADLLGFLGVGPGRLQWDQETLTAGDESLPMAAARAAVLSPPIRSHEPRRALRVEDL